VLLLLRISPNIHRAYLLGKEVSAGFAPIWSDSDTFYTSLFLECFLWVQVSLASLTIFKMVLIQKKPKVAYKHILDNFLGRSDGTDLKTSLHEGGIKDIFDLINISDATIDFIC
jgi:hypothetical protein